MGFLSAAITALKEEIYPLIPEIDCKACGKCCVSPHMTFLEFCFILSHLAENPDYFIDILSKNTPFHEDYPGHLTCRFQTAEKLCGIYPYRTLTCRLHGHPVVKEMGLQTDIPCTYAKPVKSTLGRQDLYGLIDRLTELNDGFYSYYRPPYWISGLNTETWLTILFSEMPQNIFQLLQKLMQSEFDLQDFGAYFTQPVKLREKITLIDTFHKKRSLSRPEALCPMLEKIKTGFPLTGAYYVIEANMYLEELEQNPGRTEYHDIK